MKKQVTPDDILQFKAKMNLFEAECMDKYGFYVHMVFFTKPTNAKKYMNHHTHGLPETYNHKDIQLVFIMPTNIIGGIFHSIVDRIKDGVIFEPGKRYDQVLVGYDVKFIDAVENGREVLRVILPDKEGRFPDEQELEPPYSYQLDDIEDLE